MPMLKVGKAPSTIAESIHEAEGVTASAPVAVEQAPVENVKKPQYYAPLVDGQPHVVFIIACWMHDR
jgi:hypothetical protein